MTGREQVPSEFEKRLKRVLKRYKDKSGEDIRGLVKFINNSICTEEVLYACLTRYCLSFNPISVQDEGQRKLGLSVGYNLFSRSIDLIGILDDTGRLIPDMVKMERTSSWWKIPRDMRYPAYLERWLQLPPEYRRELEQKATKRRREIRDGSILISPLIAAYTRKEQKVPNNMQALLDFHPTDVTFHAKFRQSFDQVAQECNLAWKKFHMHSSMKASQLESSMKRLDNAFESFRKYLKEKCSDQLVFFQVLKWIRDGGKWSETIKVKGGRVETHKSSEPWSSIWHELYLEASYQAYLFAIGKWNILAIQKARSLYGQDRDFFLAAITDPSEHLKLDTRLKWAFKNGQGFIETNRQRRRNEAFARYSNFTYVDEFETIEIQNLIDYYKKQKPEYLKNTYAEIASNYAVIKGNVRINQSILDSFTIVWIKDGKDGKKEIIIEFHKMPNVLYKTDEGEVKFLIRKALWTYIAKIASNVIQFMLAYLELVGLAVDVISAGTAGGFRRIAFEFIKEEMKDRATSELLDAFHIKDPVIRAAAQVGVNFLHVPKGRPDTNIDRGTRTLPPATKQPPPSIDQSTGRQLGDRFIEGKRATPDDQANVIDFSKYQREMAKSGEPPRSEVFTHRTPDDESNVIDFSKYQQKKKLEEGRAQTMSEEVFEDVEVTEPRLMAVGDDLGGALNIQMVSPIGKRPGHSGKGRQGSTSRGTDDRGTNRPGTGAKGTGKSRKKRAYRRTYRIEAGLMSEARFRAIMGNNYGVYLYRIVDIEGNIKWGTTLDPFDRAYKYKGKAERLEVVAGPVARAQALSAETTRAIEAGERGLNIRKETMGEMKEGADLYTVLEMFDVPEDARPLISIVLPES